MHVLAWPQHRQLLADAYCDCITPLALDVTTWLGYCNSMLNPIIYAFTVKEFKRTIAKAFSPCLLAVRA